MPCTSRAPQSNLYSSVCCKHVFHGWLNQIIITRHSFDQTTLLPSPCTFPYNTKKHTYTDRQTFSPASFHLCYVPSFPIYESHDKQHNIPEIKNNKNGWKKWTVVQLAFAVLRLSNQRLDKLTQPIIFFFSMGEMKLNHGLSCKFLCEL